MTRHCFVVLAYKESSFLEECILSVTNQSYHSEVIIATSTPNEYIDKLANKYHLPVCVNSKPGMGIGRDFDFAVFCSDAKLVTVAHQDDIYEYEYAERMVENYLKYEDTTILFSDYFEIKDGVKVTTNINLKIKRILLLLLNFKGLSKFKCIKRSALAFGNAICCPAVTFVKANINATEIFACDLKCNIDWYAWEKLSKKQGRFIFVKQLLMGHRVHEESTTTEIIQDNIRTKEDVIMFEKFWPSSIAKLLNKFYKNAEKSNQLK